MGWEALVRQLWKKLYTTKSLINLKPILKRFLHPLVLLTLILSILNLNSIGPLIKELQKRANRNVQQNPEILQQSYHRKFNKF